jgi:hypothetical protein
LGSRRLARGQGADHGVDLGEGLLDTGFDQGRQRGLELVDRRVRVVGPGDWG